MVLLKDPDLFNIFIYDIFYVLEQSTLYNYADDNIVCHTSDKEKEHLACLKGDLSNLMSLFKTNCVGVNGGNLQCMFISNESNKTINVNIDNTVLSPRSNIKILGVTIDKCLIFDEQINIICSNAARQLNVKHLQCNLDEESGLSIYRSYFLSNFNYCPLFGIFVEYKIEEIWKRFKKEH